MNGWEYPVVKNVKGISERIIIQFKGVSTSQTYAI